MLQALTVAIFVLAAATAVVLWLVVGLARRPAGGLDSLALERLLRVETDLLRGYGEDQARGLRQELGENLRGSIRSLGEAMNAALLQFGDRLENSVAAIARKLDEDIGAMAQDASKNRDGLRQLVEGKLDSAAGQHAQQALNLRDELGASFQRFGGAVTQTLTEHGERQKERLAELGERQRERLEGHARALGALDENLAKSQEALRQAVENRLDVIRQDSASKLEDMRRTVDEKLQTTLDTRLGESFNRVVEQLNRVHEGLGEMKSLASNVGDLRNVLTNVKVRGTFGEVQLGMMLEQFLTPDQYLKDARVREHSAERVEFAIRFPGKGGGEEVLLPIDAKFPRETYERLVEASERGDAALVEIHRKQLLAQVRACAKDIRDKYVHPPRTTDFALLFLPTEGLFAEVLRQPGAFETVQREFKVTLAGPTTLSAILNAFQMGFRSIAIERRSSEVWQVLGAVQSEFNKYNAVVETLGRQLSTAASSVEKLGQRTRTMSRKLKTVEALPEGTSGAALLGLDPEAEAEEAEADQGGAGPRRAGERA